MKMLSRLSIIFLLAAVGSSAWAVSSDIDSRASEKNFLSEETERLDDSKPLIDRRSDLDDVDFSSFFDMDIDDDDKDNSNKDTSKEGKESSSSASNSESSDTAKKNSSPGIQNQVVVGPYQVSVVDSGSALLSSLGLRQKHLQHLTSSAYAPYSRRRSSYSSRSYSPYPVQTSESVRSSSYAEYPSQNPGSYGHSRPPPPPNSYPQDRNKEYVPMGGHYRGSDRELPHEHPAPYAQEKVYPPNSVDHPPPYGSYKSNYVTPPPSPPAPSNPGPHDQQSSDAYRGGYYSNPHTDPKYQTPNRGPYSYQEPAHQPSAADGHEAKDNYDPNYNRGGWRQSSQHPLHPAPLPHRASSYSAPSSYSQHKPYSPSSSPTRTYEKTPYPSPSSSYSRPSDASHSYSKSQYGGPPTASDKRPYQSHSPSHHYPSYHSSSGSPKSKTPHRAGSVGYGDDSSYHSHHHSPLPSKPMITVKFKARAPDHHSGHHGLSIPLSLSPLEVVKKLATPLAALNPLANKKVTIGITIEQKDKHSDVLHSY